MEFKKKTKKLVKLLTPNQPTKFRTKNLIEINDDIGGNYNTHSQG